VLRLEVPGAGNRADPVVRVDAEQIGRYIAAAVHSGSRAPEDFLILFRRRRFMGAYARVLEAHGIPFEIAGGGAFDESDELGALLPVLESLADPDDPVPFVAALRGPVFGVDDDALFRFASAGGRFRFTAELPAGADARIVRAAGLLRDAFADVEALPPAAAIARLCGRLGLTALAAAEELGESRAGNLLKALAAARKFSGEGCDFPGVVRELARMRDEDLIEQMSIEPGRAGVVRLMTLHGAKGLEARVVFLAEPAADNFPPRNFWVDREGETPVGYFRIVQRLGKRGEQDLAVPPGWDAMCEAEESFERAEHVRLLYVGATRAEEMLVVSIKRMASGRAAGPWAPLDRHLPAMLALPGPPAAAAPPPLPGLSAAPDAARTERERRRASAARPTYGVVAVTDVAHTGEKPAWESTGRGMSWGRVLHGALEAAMRDPKLDLALHAANLLAAEERPAADLADVLRVVEGVRASPLWKRALASKRRFAEVPFALPVEPMELGLAAAPGPTVLQGTIDLVFEEAGGWVLVDYKSDTVTPANRSTLETFYAPQIGHYRRYWESLTGQPTKAGLFFLATGELAMLPDPSMSPSHAS